MNPELAGGEVDLGDRLIGRVHRDERRRLESVPEPGEEVGEVAVGGAAHRPPQRIVADFEEPQGPRRVDQHEVDAQLAEALVHQLGQVGGGAVEGVRHRIAPPRRHGEPVVDDGRIGPPVGEDGRVHHLGLAGKEAIAQGGPAGFFEVGDDLVVDQGHELHEVPVGVDDRVTHPFPDFRRGQVPMLRHGVQSPSSLSREGRDLRPRPNSCGLNRHVPGGPHDPRPDSGRRRQPDHCPALPPRSPAGRGPASRRSPLRSG